MVKNNRVNEEDLREGIKEKARLAAEQAAKEKVLESEKEQRDHVFQDDDPRSDKA